LAELITLFAVTDCYPDQSLEGERAALVLVSLLDNRKSTKNVKKERASEELGRLGSKENP
jgi:hypothetical protein